MDIQVPITASIYFKLEHINCRNCDHHHETIIPIKKLGITIDEEIKHECKQISTELQKWDLENPPCKKVLFEYTSWYETQITINYETITKQLIRNEK